MKEKVISILELSRRDVEFLNGTLHTIMDLDKAAFAIEQLVCDKVAESIHAAFMGICGGRHQAAYNMTRQELTYKGYSDTHIDNALKKITDKSQALGLCYFP